MKLLLYLYMRFDALKDYVFEQLENRLDSTLYYHGAHHTHYVYNAALHIADHERIMGQEHAILMTAVLLHDFGFIETYNDHEEKGCLMARKILPEYSYNEAQIELICSMIMRTKIPQIAVTKLEEIICDADLDYLGREDFHEIADKLRVELRENGKITSDRKWDEIQVAFLTNHRYFTQTAIQTRNEGKAKHLEEIKERLLKNNYAD